MEGRSREIQEIYGLTISQLAESTRRNPYVHELSSWFAAFTVGVIPTNILSLEKKRKIGKKRENLMVEKDLSQPNAALQMGRKTVTRVTNETTTKLITDSTKCL